MSRDAGLRQVYNNLPAKERTPGDEEALREKVAALVGRARDAGVVRAHVTATTYIALITGLSAAIDAGCDWRLAADVLLAGLRGE